MASNYGSAVKEAILLLDKFNASRLCLDDFMEDAPKDLPNMDNLHKTFILDVVSGCIEYKKILDVVIRVFYGQKGKYLSGSDHSRFVIICYLTTFSLDDLGLQGFRNLVHSQDIKKMQLFLTFFFENLTTWIQSEWNKIYDAVYVEELWIGPLLRWRPEIDALMEQLAVKASQRNQIKKVAFETTEPKEFSFTKPKPRRLPVPELIPQQEKYKPVPSSTYKAPKVIHKIKELKQKNRKKTEELLYEANTKQFSCADTPKSQHTEAPSSTYRADKEMQKIEELMQKNQQKTEKVMSQIKEASLSEAELIPQQEKYKPVPSSTYKAPKEMQKMEELKQNNMQKTETSSWPIKLNSAAILRQRVLTDRQVEEELQRLESLMEGAREPSSFLQWQKEMRERDLREELVKIERRHLEGRISYKRAAMAPKLLMDLNQRTAQLKKEERAELMRKYAEKRLQEEKEMRDLVQQVVEGHKNSKMAKEKLQKIKQTIVKEVSEQSRELLRQALDEAQAELSRKFEVIQEIHAIESLPQNRIRLFDDTETAGHGLLGDMSLVELKERLAFRKQAQQAQQQEKREQILTEKQNKKQLQLEDLATISLYKRVQAQSATIRKEEKTTRRALQSTVRQDETILALQRELEETEKEYQRLKQIESKKAKAPKQTTAHAVKHRDQ